MNKKNITILLSAFLCLFLLGGLWYFNFRDQSKLSAQDVAQKAIDYLNDNLLPDELSASLISAIEKEDIVEMSFDIAGQEYNSYVTKSGDLFFVEGIDLNEKIIEVEEAQGEITKSEKPDISLFVMSYCPYGLQAQKVFLPVSELLSDKVNMDIRFVDYIMHGEEEIDENLRQYCIQKEQEEKYNDYLGCFVEDGDFEDCLASTNIDQGKMNSCIVEVDQNYNIYSQYEDQNTWLGGSYPRFDVELDLNEQYGVGGSPTLVINGAMIITAQKDCPVGKECVVIPDMQRTPEKYKEVICQAFTEQPEECSQVLSVDGFAAGFGLEESEDSSNASCE